MSLTKRINALKQKRSECHQASRAILDTAEEAGRDMTADEQAKFKDLHTEDNSLKAQIGTLQTQLDAENDLGGFTPDAPSRAAPSGHAKVSGDELLRGFVAGPTRNYAGLGDAVAGTPYADPAWLGHDKHGEDSPIQLGSTQEHEQLQAQFAAAQRQGMSLAELRELRANDITNPGKGQETVPTGFVRNLEDKMLAYSNIAQVCQVLRTSSGNPLEWPTGDNVDKGAMIAEATDAGNLDLAFGQLLLSSYKFTSREILMSMELVQDSAFNMVGYASSKAGERIGRIENEKATIGTGSGEPQGITVGASDSGLTPTATLTSDLLLQLVHTVDPAYRSGAMFMLHDETLLAIKQLKDSEGRPLWMPNLIGREPDTFHGYRYTINQDMPKAGDTAGRFVLFGAMRKHLVRSVAGIRLNVLRELYAKTDQVAVIAYHRMDSKVLQPEAIKYLASDAA